MYFELKNISVHYDKVQALENVTLHLEQGEIVALIGANGAGKTSTLRAITSLVRPSSGEIWFGGKRIDRPRTGGGGSAWDLHGAGGASCLSVHVGER